MRRAGSTAAIFAGARAAAALMLSAWTFMWAPTLCSFAGDVDREKTIASTLKPLDSVEQRLNTALNPPTKESLVESHDSSADTCDGELLYNGICLPADQPWPPAWNTSYYCKRCNTTYHGGPPSRPRYPPWYYTPPKVINITVGRQLFVDTFLIESMLGLQLSGHEATWDEQVMKAVEPWESQTQASSGVPYDCDFEQTYPVDKGWMPSSKAPKWFQCGWPQGPKAVGYAGVFEGAVVYDEDRRLFRMFCAPTLFSVSRHSLLFPKRCSFEQETLCMQTRVAVQQRMQRTRRKGCAMLRVMMVGCGGSGW